MFSRLEVRGYRSLKAVDTALRPFQVVVGPNASGKTTLLETLDLLGRIMRGRGDVREAVLSVAPNFHDLLWRGEGRGFTLIVEAPLPDRLRPALDGGAGAFDAVAYRLSVSLDPESDEIGIDDEMLLLFRNLEMESDDRSARLPATMKLITRPHENGATAFYFPDEGDASDAEAFAPFRSRLDARTSALQATPADGRGYRVAEWLRGVLADGVRRIDLEDRVLAAPAPPGLGSVPLPDGANLPRVLAALRRDATRFGFWLRHVRSALPELRDVEVVERPEDRATYLRLTYDNGARVPSWLVSAGTLRLFALTVLPYIATEDVVYLIEEPETGIHPRALEAVMESLRSIYGGQVLATTHSLLVVNLVEVEELLCASLGAEGETVLVPGPLHPVLARQGGGGSSLGTLFASGSLTPLP